MLKLRALVVAASLSIVACSPQSSDTAESATGPKAQGQAAAAVENPFFAPSSLPFQAPPFDRIQESDYQPAIEEGMRQHLAEIEAIANDAAEPSFENTFVALEKSGALYNRVMPVFNAVSGANTTDSLQKLQEELAPKQAEYRDAIVLNERLFQRIEAIHAKVDSLNLDPESRRLVDVTYRSFVSGGAKLSAEHKARLKELNKEESTLSTQFGNKLLGAAKEGALVVDAAAQLAGLSEGEISAAAAVAKDRGLEGKWVLPLRNTTQQPPLQTLTDRSTREQLFQASWNRAEKGDANDTRKTIARIAQIRAEQAKLLGFSNYAAWALEDQMAKTPETALAFMRHLAPAAAARARSEAEDIQAVIDASKGGFQLAAWDWQHYAEQVRKAKYDLDESQIKPYFELDRVLQDGVFYAANQLYGLSFKERKDIPAYHADVRAFEVFDRDGSSLALFYVDYFKRDNKNGGAWMDNLVPQSRLLGTRPVIFNVCNFDKPVEGQPALISFDDVGTMFHEFGHALHGLFADGQYPSLSGTSTARDFVEFPSQFNEYWATEPRVFANYAKHYQTGEAMPQAMVDKIKKADTFNKGYDMSELTAAALLDMNWHSLAADAPLQDPDQFEAAALKREGLDLPYVPPRYRSSYFLHIWGNGYAAGYYAYLWTQMLADDSYQWFEEHGGMTRENGDRFRAMVLSRGNSEDLSTLYREFRGQDPSVEPMLLHRGLK